MHERGGCEKDIQLTGSYYALMTDDKLKPPREGRVKDPFQAYCIMGAEPQLELDVSRQRCNRFGNMMIIRTLS